MILKLELSVAVIAKYVFKFQCKQRIITMSRRAIVLQFQKISCSLLSTHQVSHRWSFKRFNIFALFKYYWHRRFSHYLFYTLYLYLSWPCFQPGVAPFFLNSDHMTQAFMILLSNTQRWEKYPKIRYVRRYQMKNASKILNFKF